MIGHVSNGLKSSIETVSRKVEISRDEFIALLTKAGLRCELRGHRLLVTNWGHDFAPQVIDENYQLVSEQISEEFGWSMMLRAGSDSEYRTSYYYDPEDDECIYVIEDEVTIDKSGRTVSYVPQLRGAGYLPKSIEAQILGSFNCKPFELHLREPLAKVPGHYWPDADAGMMHHPDVVEVTCFGSEASAMAAFFQESESDYRNFGR